MTGATTSKPRVYRIISALNMGGVEKRLTSILPLLSRDFEVKVVCIRERGDLADELESRGIEVLEVPFHSRLDPRSIYRLVRVLRSGGARIAHMHMYRPHVSGTIAAALAGVPVRISNVHNVNQWDSKRQIRMDARVARFSHSVISVSEAVKQNYIENTGVPETRCRVIYNGVDTDMFRPESPRQDIYNSLGLDEGVPVLASIGRLVRQKDHRIFLEAAVQIHASIPDAKFLIVGDGPEKQSLMEYTRDNGLQDSVIFTGFRDDVKDILQVVTAVVFSSHKEGFSNALLETMACGNPVIATDVGGNPEAVHDGKTGLLIPVKDCDALIKASLKLLQTSGLAESLGQSARELVVKQFSLQTMYEQTRQLYLELLTSNHVNKTFKNNV